jgi:hypothetical protein
MTRKAIGTTLLALATLTLTAPAPATATPAAPAQTTAAPKVHTYCGALYRAADGPTRRCGQTIGLLGRIGYYKARTKRFIWGPSSRIAGRCEIYRPVRGSDHAPGLFRGFPQFLRQDRRVITHGSQSLRAGGRTYVRLGYLDMRTNVFHPVTRRITAFELYPTNPREASRCFSN